jgi:DNA-binding MarR family transcriptional regulator
MGLPRELAYPSLPDDADEVTRLAATTWGQVARLFLGQQHVREQIAVDLGLALHDLIALFHLDPEQGLPQRSLADQWICDPSWVTNRVDHFEQLGLVERRVSPTDRRVKEVWLTRTGRTVRAAGMAGFAQPPAALTSLAIDDLRALESLLGRLDLPEIDEAAP